MVKKTTVICKPIKLAEDCYNKLIIITLNKNVSNFVSLMIKLNFYGCVQHISVKKYLVCL